MKRTLTMLALATMVAGTAHAQPAGRIAIGAGVGFRDYTDGKFHGRQVAVVPEYQIGLSSNPKRQGLSFGLKGGVGYSKPDRDEFIGGSRTAAGSMQSVTVMVGAGPTYRSGPFSVGLAVLAGPSFNSFSIDDDARVAYAARLGSNLNAIDVKNSIAVRPSVSLWYNLVSRVGMHTSVSYTVNRPTVETTINNVRTERQWNADRWNYQVGLGVGLF